MSIIVNMGEEPPLEEIREISSLPRNRKEREKEKEKERQNKKAKENPLFFSPSSSSSSSSSSSFLFKEDESEKKEKLFLVMLYFVQGLPLGLTMGSIPLLLRSSLSYAEIGIFSIASYPYSLKLLWSPIVDSCFFPSVGRRKSWVVPLQFLIAFVLFSASFYMEETLDSHVAPNSRALAVVFFLLVLLAATQDIAVDGWALSLLSEKNQSAASMCQTIGLQIGFFTSFTFFLSFNSAAFCETWVFGWEEGAGGILSVSLFMRLCAIVYVVVTFVVFWKREKEFCMDLGVGEVYAQIWDVLKLDSIRLLVLLLLVHKIPFITNDAVTALKLVDKGFGEENLGLFALIEFPAQITFALLTARWCQGQRPLNPWLIGVTIRLFLSSLAPFLVYNFPVGESVNASHPYFWILLSCTLTNTLGSTIMFVSQGTFFNRISDASIGGTYLTLLNTLSNFGGTWPKMFVYFLVDYLSTNHCISPTGSVLSETCNPKAPQECIDAGGECVWIQDGYYLCAGTCSVVGFLLFFFLRSKVDKLQSAPLSAWSPVSEEPSKTK